jgi:hypothetical protein
VADVVREDLPGDLQLLIGGVYSAARPNSVLTHVHVVANTSFGNDPGKWLTSRCA